MAIKQFTKEWTRQTLYKSILYFFLHFMALVLLGALLLFGDKFSSLGAHMSQFGAGYLYVLICALMLVIIMYFYYYFEDKSMISSGRNISLLFILLDVSFIASWLIGEFIDIFARPMALMALLAFVLIDRRSAIFMNIISALLIFVVDTFAGGMTADSVYYTSLIITFAAGMFAIFCCNRARTRFQIVAVGATIVIPIDVTILILEISTLVEGVLTPFEAFRNIIMHMGFGLFGGVISTILFLAILPIFEVAFNCLTAYRLRELTSQDAKVLKELKEKAPGTYNHSVVVSQLAEAAAAAIGEDVDCARAAAMYHDVGKLHYPEHFTENQGEYNLHDELTPELSADIIRSHAKDGYMLIKANHLPEFLADVALQHHGTLPIRYFYAKALKMTDGELNIEDFSYMGPKPQSKLAAIIMIADASEAAVRAVNARKPEEVEKCIRGIIEERMDLEQFSECDITMVEITKIKQALIDTLTGVYHHRVKYPTIKYKKSSSGDVQGGEV